MQMDLVVLLNAVHVPVPGPGGIVPGTPGSRDSYFVILRTVGQAVLFLLIT